MIAIANEEGLYLIPGYTQPIRSIENELKQYFAGSLKEFKTPLFFLGSPFNRVFGRKIK